ncbi:MAG: arginine--tRNA ligase [Clostridia bacterium]
MNYIELTKKQANDIILNAYNKACQNGQLDTITLPNFVVEIPKDTSKGDYATSFAMQCSKLLRKKPQDIATIIIENMELDGTYFSDVTIAGPGFINFSLNSDIYAEIAKTVYTMGKEYGKTDYFAGQKIMVEFVSANPTGPMHMGNARGGVLGDCLAETLKWSGADVTREFLINDAGNQVNKFAHSLEGRFIQIIKGDDAIEFAEDWYQGEDIREVAQKFIDANGTDLIDADAELRREKLAEFGLVHNIAKMKADLARYKIDYDVWFNESTLHAAGAVEKTVNILIENGNAYKDEEGTIFIKSTELFGSDKDDVLMRANGVYTYFAADIAYHVDKFITRGFNTVINIWGADHHGHVKRLQRALDAVGANGSDNLEVVLMQLVRLMRDGEVVRMSKRTGKAISLTDLLDEIPIDAARFFFNSRSSDTHLEFDLDLAVKQDSDNPVYYVGYAHARIVSILKNLSAEKIVLGDINDVDLSLLVEPEEINLIKLLANFPEEIKNAARDRDPSKMNKYAIALAGAFHKFYNAVRIRDAKEDVRLARMVLCQDVKTVIANCLGIIGIDAPEQM